MKQSNSHSLKAPQRAFLMVLDSLNDDKPEWAAIELIAPKRRRCLVSDIAK